MTTLENGITVARETVKQALIDCLADTLANSDTYRRTVACDGFAGVEQMDTSTLCHEAVNAELDERPDVFKALATLGHFDKDVAEWAGLHYRVVVTPSDMPQWRERFVKSSLGEDGP